jgi:chromosome segregation ATPase
MSAREIQISIDNATRELNTWSAELMRLNRELSSAKIGKRASLRKAIKNAEQAIADYNRQIKKLNDDLAKILKAEVKNQDNLELAKQGISPGAKIAESLGNVATQLTPLLTGSEHTKRAQLEAPKEETATKNNTMIYIIVAVAVLLLMKMKK